MKENYNLTFKDNWQIFLISDYTNKVRKDIEYRKENNLPVKTNEGRFLDFLGYKFHRRNCLDNENCRVTIRKSNALRIRRKAKHIYKKKANIYDARQMVTYIGICKYSNCFNWFNNNVLQYVSIKRLEKKISDYDKEHNQIEIEIIIQTH